MKQQHIPIHTQGMKEIALKVLSGMPLPCEITIQPYKTKRSNAQNRLYWKWLTEISQQIEVADENGELSFLSKEDWHDLCRMKWLGVKVINLQGKEYPRPAKSTTALKVGEFVEYLTEIESHFLAKGAVLTFPDEYGLAMGKE